MIVLISPRLNLGVVLHRCTMVGLFIRINIINLIILCIWISRCVEQDRILYKTPKKKRKKKSLAFRCGGNSHHRMILTTYSINMMRQYLQDRKMMATRHNAFYHFDCCNFVHWHQQIMFVSVRQCHPYWIHNRTMGFSQTLHHTNQLDHF